MSDTPFRSLASETSDPLTRQLLESARADGSEHGARDRALLGLGLAPVGLLAAGAPAAASASGAPVGTAVGGGSKGVWLLFGKSLTIGVAGSLMVVGALQATLDKPAQLAAPAASAVPAITAAPTAVPVDLSVPEPTTATQPAEPTGGAPFRRRVRSLGPHEAENVAQASSQATSDSAQGPSVARRPDAAAQLAALASVRSALAAHQPGRALSLLDDFGRRFPVSQVAEEAAVLRIETLGALGRMSEARAMGLRFLRDRPGSIYGTRVRAVTQFAAQSR